MAITLDQYDEWKEEEQRKLDEAGCSCRWRFYRQNGETDAAELLSEREEWDEFCPVHGDRE